MRGGGCIGVRPGDSPYINHNWCGTCEIWCKGKPKRCPECNKLCRWSGRWK